MCAMMCAVAQQTLEKAELLQLYSIIVAVKIVHTLDLGKASYHEYSSTTMC